MADERTQDALDALADLFLTCLEPKGNPSAAASTSAERSASMPASAPAPSGKPPLPESSSQAASPAIPEDSMPSPAEGDASMDDEAMLDGPPPIRLGPKLKPADSFGGFDAKAGSSAPPFDDSLLDDAFAAPATPGPTGPTMAMDGYVEVPGATPYLRLHRHEMDSAAPSQPGESSRPSSVNLAPTSSNGHGASKSSHASTTQDPSDDDAGCDDQDSTPLQVEAVMLGNLPGMGGPWLAQYAQGLAQQEGPVAVLHVDDLGIDLEIVDGDETSANHRLPKTNDLVGLLESLMRSRSAPLRTILVHHEPTAQPQGLSRLLSISQWTFLCGADEIATAGVCQTLKRMIDAAPSTVEARRQRVGLMVMGSDAAASRAAGRRVQSSTTSVLDVPVQLVGYRKRMEPVRVRQGGSFEGLDQIWPRLEALFERYGAAAVEVSDDAVTVEAAEPSTTAEPALAGVGEAVGTGGEAIFETAGPAASAPVMEDEGSTVAVAEPVVTQQRGSRMETPAATTADATAQTAQVDLMALIAPRAIAGGIALEARCPKHPATQLALDQEGRLHLLRRHEPDERLDDVATLQQAVLDLMEAHRWVRQHLNLLAMTQRQLRFDASASPRLHLFTPRADLATGLITRLGETLNLHLLQQVHVGDRSTWFCTPLS